MFGFKKKEQPKSKVSLCVASPAEGKLIDLESVKDEVFSAKMMGEGFAVIPQKETIVSPVEGTLVSVFPTGHAIGIRTKDNVDVLVHVGLDTVGLNGEGFEVFVKEGQRVQQGEELLKFSQDVIDTHRLDPTVMVVFTEGFKRGIKVHEKPVKAGDVLIRI